MNLSDVSKQNRITTVTLVRDKVHALNEPMVDRLREIFDDLQSDPDTGAIILTGEGSFFSFGFDVPELYDYSKADCGRYLTKVTSLYASIFVHPKPVVAALNGHVVAGGCVLATACDYRLMVTGKAKASLNEITFGATIFACAMAMLRAVVGQKNAETMALGGAMYSAEQAHEFGLVDRVVSPDELMPAAIETAKRMAGQDAVAYAAQKRLLRDPIADDMIRREPDAIRKFIDIWYSPSTREKLKSVTIR